MSRTDLIRCICPTLLTYLVTAIVAGAPAARAASPYIAHDIGALLAEPSFATGISSDGRVTLAASDPTMELRGFCWSSQDGLTDIGSLAGKRTWACSVNATGEVAGYSYVGTVWSRVSRPLYWKKGVMRELAMPDGAMEAKALDINDNGQIAGVYWDDRYNAHAIVWSPDGSSQELMFPDGSTTAAISINARGQVVGVLGPNGLQTAVIWRDGQAEILPRMARGFLTYADGVNSLEQVVGWVAPLPGTTSGSKVAALWDVTGSPKVLGVLPGYQDSIAESINDRGQVVGYSYTDTETERFSRAFVYTNGVMEDLTNLVSPADGWVFTEAQDINNAGQIAATAIKDGVVHAFRLDLGTMRRLVFRSAPTSTLVNAPLGPTIVEIRNPDGAIATDFNGAVSLGVLPGSGATGAVLGGTTTVSAVDGVARFDSVSIDRVGAGYILRAEASGILSATTPAFNVGIPVLYVRSAGSDANDGSSWASAKATIQAAIDTPLRVPTSEIWISTGVYSFISVPSGTMLYGGFEGTETSREQRNPVEHPTTIYGESHNCLVTIAPGATPETIVDGFCLDGGGTGMSIQWAAPTIRNNRFQNNSQSLACSDHGKPIIENNVFTGASYAAISIWISSPIIRGNLLLNNPGSGIDISGFTLESAATITNNTIVGNKSNFGGGIRISSAIPLIANNIIYGNSDGIQVQSSEYVPVLRNNCVYGNSGEAFRGMPDPTGKDGNIAVDPGFIGAGSNDYRLAAGSPCLDAGDDSFVTPGSTDLDGHLRIQGLHVDIGAFEASAVPVVEMEDVVRALHITMGVTPASLEDLNQLDVVARDPEVQTIDLLDVAGLMRRLNGLDT